MASVRFNKYIRLIQKLPAEIDITTVNDESDFATIEQVNTNRLLVSKTLIGNRNQIVNSFLKKELPHVLEKLEAILDKYRSAKRIISNSEWEEDKAKLLDILTVGRDHTNQWYRSNPFIIALVTGVIGVILAFLLKDIHFFGPGSEPSVPTIDNRRTEIKTINQFSGDITIGNVYISGATITLLPEKLTTISDNRGHYAFQAKDFDKPHQLKISYQGFDTLVNIRRKVNNIDISKNRQKSPDSTLVSKPGDLKRWFSNDKNKSGMTTIIPRKDIDLSLTDTFYKFHYVLKEHYSDWSLGLSGCGCNIFDINGVLTYKGVSDYPIPPVSQVNFDENKDFLITYVFKWVKGSRKQWFGGSFEHDEHIDDSYFWAINADGGFESMHSINGSAMHWIETTSNYVNKGNQVNTIQIKKTGGYVTGFINGHQMNSYKYKEMAGSYISLHFQGKQEVQILDFKVHGTPRKS